MEGLEILEEILFAQEFSDNPHIPPFKIVVDGNTWKYKVTEANNKYYIVTDD